MEEDDLVVPDGMNVLYGALIRQTTYTFEKLPCIVPNVPPHWTRGALNCGTILESKLSWTPLSVIGVASCPRC